MSNTSQSSALQAAQVRLSILKFALRDHMMRAVLKQCGYFLAFTAATWLAYYLNAGRDDFMANVMFWFGMCLGAICILGVYVFVKLYRRTAAKYWFGALTPAVVFALDPPEMLALANLSTGLGPDVYAVKRTLLSHPPGEMPKVGDRVAAVSSFQSGEDTSCWRDFDPEPLWTATDNAALLQSRLDQIDPAYFKMLDAAIASNNVPARRQELLILNEASV